MFVIMMVYVLGVKNTGCVGKIAQEVTVVTDCLLW